MTLTMVELLCVNKCCTVWPSCLAPCLHTMVMVVVIGNLNGGDQTFCSSEPQFGLVGCFGNKMKVVGS